MADHSTNDVDPSVSANSSDSEFHPSYSDPDADIVLQSGDGVKFRVHSLIMKMASGFFRDMLGLPGNADAEEPIVMKEKVDIIVALLDVIYPNASLPKISPNLIWDVAATADRYEMPRAIQTLSHIVTFNLGQIDPILTYSLACRYGWEDVAKAASTKTLEFDLSTLTDLRVSRMDGPSLFRLQKLHRTRRDKLFELMDIEFAISLPEGGRVSFCNCVGNVQVHKIDGCCRSRGRSLLWILMKHSVSKEMEECPLGKALYHDGFWRRAEFAGLWTSGFGGCCGESCPPFDRLATKTEVLRVLKSKHLPKTVLFTSSPVQM